MNGYLQREKSYFLWFQSVKSCQVKFVCITQYPIQGLNGLSGPTTATAQSPSSLRRQEENPPENDKPIKNGTNFEEIQKEILLPLQQYVCQQQSTSDARWS